jgi:glutaredoxin
MPKLDWVPIVDRVLDVADRALDRVRKTPRKRLDVVPPSKAPPDPFAPVARPAPAPPSATPAAAAAKASDVPEPVSPAPPTSAPLGDPSIAAQVYGRRTCMWSGRAQRLLLDLGAEVRFCDLDAPEHRPDEVRLVRETKQPEQPWVYVRGSFVGGFRALDELARLGKLEELLLPPGERPVERKRRVRIEAPAPPGEHHAPAEATPPAKPSEPG